MIAPSPLPSPPEGGEGIGWGGCGGDSMNMTRRQFGMAVIGALVALVFGRIFRFLGAGAGPGGRRPSRARFWTRTDHLAG